MDKRSWRAAKDLDHFRCAPPANGGRRLWDLDSLLLLAWFHSLFTAGMTRTFAGLCADGLRQAMQARPRAKAFGVYTIEKDGYGELVFSTDPPDDPTAQHVFTVPVAEWRKSIEARVDDFFAREAGRDGSPLPS